MIARIGAAIGLAAALSGCANERAQRFDFDHRPSMLGGGVGGGSDAALPEKTMGDKMLTAMALERVTGLKPDPARLLTGN